ncbi:MAG: hypothetical protein GY820_03255, partial [Gammaproteobacteria bacterium]|nr:hypothetical protein [Gammaproteobacteria bacterium]
MSQTLSRWVAEAALEFDGRTDNFKRRRMEEERHEKVVADFLESDILSDVSELESRLKMETVPSGFIFVSIGNLLLLCYRKNVPLLRASITIDEDMEYFVVFD